VKKIVKALGLACIIAASGCQTTLAWMRDDPRPDRVWASYTYPTLGVEVELLEDVRPRYQLFMAKHKDIGRLDALEYLALEPGVCAQPVGNCSFYSSRRNVHDRVREYLQRPEANPDARFTISDSDAFLKSGFLSARVVERVTVQLRTDTVFVDRELPEGVLTLDSQGRRYTFPGASVVCYERPERRCVQIPR